MITLGIDTAGGACSAALVTAGGAVLAHGVEIMPRGQSERLIPMVIELMAQAGCDWAAIGLVAVTVGPGAFTGLRIGLAAARGLALARDIPVAGVSSFDALAAGLAGPVAVAIDTRRDDLFLRTAGEVEGRLVTRAAAAKALAGENCALAGDGAVMLAPQLDLAGAHAGIMLHEGVTLPDPGAIARLGHDAHVAGTALAPEPVYLRDPDAVPARPGRTIRQA